MNESLGSIGFRLFFTGLTCVCLVLVFVEVEVDRSSMIKNEVVLAVGCGSDVDICS